MWKNRAKALGWTSICKINGKSLFDEYRNTKMDCKKKAPSDFLVCHSVGNEKVPYVNVPSPFAT